jgi:hypothetical protein
MAGSGLVGGCLLTACQPVPGLPLPPGQLQQQDQSAPAGRDPRCEASYPDDCLYFDPALRDSDYDCWGGTGNGPRYVDHPLRVVYNVDRPDPFGLDRNQNRIGCKSAVASPAPSTPQP